MAKSNEVFSSNGPQFIGLAGTAGAGKDTAADHLVEHHGFMHVSTSNLLREESIRQGLDKERETLIEVGIKLREKYGSQGALILLGIEQWQEQRDRYMGGLVVTAMRAVGEAEEIIAQNGTLAFVEAPIGFRYSRIFKRGRDGEIHKTFEEFVDQDRREYEGDPHNLTRPNLKAIKAMSHYSLMNEEGHEEIFVRSIEDILSLEHRGNFKKS